jgi:hypothetical protein
MDSRIARSAHEKATDEKRAVTIASTGLRRELVRVDIREHEVWHIKKSYLSRALDLDEIR